MFKPGLSSNFSLVSTQHLSFFSVSSNKSPVLSLFTKLWTVFSAGNSFIVKFKSKFSPILSSKSVLHIDVIKKFSLLWSILHCSLTVAENKWFMVPISAAYCWQAIKKLPRTNFLPWNIMLSSGPQVQYFPSSQMLSAIRHADSSAKHVCTSQQEVPQSTAKGTLYTAHHKTWAPTHKLDLNLPLTWPLFNKMHKR
jgi:hypothetical protein